MILGITHLRESIQGQGIFRRETCPSGRPSSPDDQGSARGRGRGELYPAAANGRAEIAVILPGRDRCGTGSPTRTSDIRAWHWPSDEASTRDDRWHDAA